MPRKAAPERAGEPGRRDEFASIFASESHRLVRLAYLLVSNPDTAEDVVAAAVSRVWPVYARRTLDDPVAYLRRAVVNEALGRRRRASVARRVAERLRPRADDTYEAAADEHLIAGTLLRRALGTLTTEQRAVIVLRFYEDLSEEAVAGLLGIPVGTVKSRVARALARLRNALEEVQVHD